MSDHSRAFVPIEAWCYSSPSLKYSGKSIDIGLMAESLIYYDNIYLNINTQQDFAEILKWFINQGKFEFFLSLLRDGIIIIYHYAFATAPINKDDKYIIMNIQDEEQKKKNTFIERFVFHHLLNDIVNNKQRKLMAEAIEGNVIEVKADDFGKPIKNARDDFQNPTKCSLLLQSLLDEVYPLIGWGKDVKVKVTIDKFRDQHRINWNMNLDKLIEGLGKKINFSNATPLAAAAVCNRTLQTTCQLKCDAFISNPMGTLLGDKLYETAHRFKNTKSIIDNLKLEVEFPDIRFLVNGGSLDLDNIIKIRKQSENDRDRNAIIAYHNEVAKESGITKLGRTTIKLFGILGPPVVGTVIGDIKGGILGAIAGASFKFMAELGSGFGSNWKPVIFGNWLDSYIKNTSGK